MNLRLPRFSRGIPPESLPHLPPQPWVYRARPWQIYVMAVGVGACVYAVSMTIDFALYRSGVSPVPMFSISDGLAALIAALFALKVVQHSTERRRAVIERLEMIAEMNHHIRNALDVIQLSAHTTRDEAAIAMVNEAVERIEWALQEILGSKDKGGGQAATDRSPTNE